jgi:hypothetical protein
MLEITPSRTGQPTAIHKGIRLHSLYDPVKEAKRFAARSIAARDPATILLLGAGLGYLITALKAAYPHARLLVVHYSREISDRCSVLPETCWDPEQPAGLSAFLRSRIAELDTEGLVVLEWPASARMYPRLSAAANTAVRQLVQEHRGSLVTTMAMGRQWLLNGFINTASMDSFLAVNSEAARLPIVIAASGPSLERAAPLLRSARSRFYLWALPSAVPFLIESGLDPDLVIVTDPGFFALYHLHPACGARGRPLKLAMPLSAATGAWRLNCSVYPVCQGNFFETALLELAGLSGPTILPRGTVAATALELGLHLGKSPIVFAGLDLCHLDIHSHARPNAFESFLTGRASRLEPLHSLLYARSLDQAPEKQRQGGRTYRTSLALRTYSGNLAESRGRDRIHRLNPSIVPLEGMSVLDAAQLQALLAAQTAGTGRGEFLMRTPVRPLRERKSRALALLAEWENHLSSAAKKADMPALLADRLALSLVYTIGAGRLAKAKRLQRRAENKAAQGEVRLLLQESRRFLQDLIARLRGGGAEDDTL